MTVKDVPNYLAYMAEQKAIDAGCAMFPDDRVTLEAARVHQLSDKPMASRFREHFLTGGGTNIGLKTLELLDQGAGGRAKDFSEVADKTMKSFIQRVVAVPQQVFKNQDWRNATGSLNLEWQQQVADIKLSLTNNYRWHPKVGRVTQRRHQVAENPKEKGVQEFFMVGAPARIPMADIQKEVASAKVLTPSPKK